jgi:hypothetical protein
MNWKLFIFVALISYGAYQHFNQRPVVHGHGVVASQQPIQSSTNNGSLEINGYTITPLESFTIEARVLSTKHYTFDRESDLSPVDLALGWGRMSDEAVLSEISIKQSGRFYYWRVKEFPIPRKEIETHSANMHMVPANPQIETLIKSARPGQVVRIQGDLIQANAQDGWRWKSSLTRNDTGAGACELVLVKSFSIQ